MGIRRSLLRWCTQPTVCLAPAHPNTLMVVFGRTDLKGTALAFCEPEMVLAAARAAGRAPAVDWQICGDELDTLGFPAFLAELAQIVAPGNVYLSEEIVRSPIVFELRRLGVRVRAATRPESDSRSAA